MESSPPGKETRFDPPRPGPAAGDIKSAPSKSKSSNAPSKLPKFLSSPTPYAPPLVTIPSSLYPDWQYPDGIIVHLNKPESAAPLPSRSVLIVGTEGKGHCYAYRGRWLEKGPDGGWVIMKGEMPVCVKTCTEDKMLREDYTLGRMVYEKYETLISEDALAVRYFAFNDRTNMELEIGATQVSAVTKEGFGFPEGNRYKVGDRWKGRNAIVIMSLHRPFERVFESSSQLEMAELVLGAWSTLERLHRLELIHTDVKASNFVVEVLWTPEMEDKVEVGKKVAAIDWGELFERKQGAAIGKHGFGTSCFLSPTAFFITLQNVLKLAMTVRDDGSRAIGTSLSIEQESRINRVLNGLTAGGWDLEAGAFSLGLSIITLLSERVSRPQGKPTYWISSDNVKTLRQLVLGPNLMDVLEKGGEGKGPKEILGFVSRVWKQYKLVIGDKNYQRTLSDYSDWFPALELLLRKPSVAGIPDEWLDLLQNSSTTADITPALLALIEKQSGKPQRKPRAVVRSTLGTSLRSSERIKSEVKITSISKLTGEASVSGKKDRTDSVYNSRATSSAFGSTSVARKSIGTAKSSDNPGDGAKSYTFSWLTTSTKKVFWENGNITVEQPGTRKAIYELYSRHCETDPFVREIRLPLNCPPRTVYVCGWRTCSFVPSVPGEKFVATSNPAFLAHLRRCPEPGHSIKDVKVEAEIDENTLEFVWNSKFG